ncbi:cytochrome P450 [Roridomyces roridus]|uniref:Cytochrome P450 n=1 Tax=Roridomyces roridus TaxID=1738132 RepID=A0AAD7BAY3_9AGAR|nr:cytochrome P450 [Roridomyces roridus]
MFSFQAMYMGAIWVASRAHGYVKGYRPLLDPHSLPGNAIPANWWHMGFMWPWIQRKHAHFNHTHDLTTLIPLLMGNGTYFAASVGVVKQIWGNDARAGLVKPVDFTTESVWGTSIVSANGEDWKRHRRVVAPAFTTKMFSRVVEESTSLYSSMKDEFGSDQVVTNLRSLLHRFTLVMICRCGFGMPVSWKQGGTSQDKIDIFDRALSVASSTLVHRLIFPKWVWSLPIKSLRHIDQSWKTVLTLLDSIAASKQAQYSSEKELGEEHAKDLFTKLISATEEDSKYTLTPSKVTGNMLSLLALMSTLVFLGLYPEEQEKAYQEIRREVKSMADMDLRDVANLKYVLACMHEAHRLVPATINLPRDVPEDMIIRSDRPVQKDILIKAGSRIIIDTMAVCHNPQTFNPSRWHDVPDHDIIMFGSASRMCVDRRFAQTEVVCFLAHFLWDWEVETVLLDGETREECFERIMAGASLYGTVFGLGEVPVRSGFHVPTHV